MDRAPGDTLAHRTVYDPPERRALESPSQACAADHRVDYAQWPKAGSVVRLTFSYVSNISNKTATKASMVIAFTLYSAI